MLPLAGDVENGKQMGSEPSECGAWDASTGLQRAAI